MISQITATVLLLVLQVQAQINLQCSSLIAHVISIMVQGAYFIISAQIVVVLVVHCVYVRALSLSCFWLLWCTARVGSSCIFGGETGFGLT